MKIRMLLLGAIVGAGAVIALASPASAYIACNRSGDCWHTESHYNRLGLGFQYYPDDWYFHRNWDDRRYRWRAYRADRGYWRNGVWITF